LVKNFKYIRYNFTAKVEKILMKLQKCQLDRDAEFYDKFHPTVKDVEANAEEKAENFRKDPKQEAGFCSFRKIW
jgi:DNA topoisomerase-1